MLFQIYADEDQDGNLVEDITVADRGAEDVKETSKEPSDSSLNKLHGLTVLEDEAHMADDEDMYEGDEDAESGDWYPDYYKQGPKVTISFYEIASSRIYSLLLLYSWSLVMT